MEFIVEFNNVDVETIKYNFMQLIKTFAEIARKHQKNGDIENAYQMYATACNYVWCGFEFKLITLETALQLIDQIAEYKYKN